MSKIEIINAHFSNPANAFAGLYIQLRCPDDLIDSKPGIDKAKEIANQFGFDSEGKADMGFPTRYGLTSAERSYWFFDVNGHYATTTPEGKLAIQAATTGPLAVYEYPQYDPRLK